MREPHQAHPAINETISKSDQAYDFLRSGIISASIEPDTPLRIQSLGRETGFGSTPVREALCRLEAEQLVVSAVNRGFRAAPVSIEQLKDLEKSRLVIEAGLLAESIETGGDQWEGRIIAAHYQLQKSELPIDRDDQQIRNNWTLKHENFHDALISGADSYWLGSFRKQIAEQLERHYHCTLGGALRRQFEDDDSMKEILHEVLGIEHHTLLMQATLDRDHAGATALLKEHIQFASKTFSEVFA